MKYITLTKKQKIIYVLTLLVVLIGDQLTKLLVSSSLRLSSPYTIIQNFFYFTYAKNEGAAWGMLQGKIALFILVAIIAGFLMIKYFCYTKEKEELTRYGLVLVFAGMLGNVIDRIYLGYVRDFLDFFIFGYDFPIFNIADCAVVIGVGLIFLEMIVEEVKRVRS